MIIRTNVPLKKITPKKEEIKKVEEPVIVKKARRKTEKVAVPVEEPVILDEPVVETDAVDDIEDLSSWLKDEE